MTFHSATAATATIAIPPPTTKETQRSLAFLGSSIDHLLHNVYFLSARGFSGLFLVYAVRPVSSHRCDVTAIPTAELLVLASSFHWKRLSAVIKANVRLPVRKLQEQLAALEIECRRTDVLDTITGIASLLLGWKPKKGNS
jgi:hypothetical protein